MGRIKETKKRHEWARKEREIRRRKM